MSESKLPLDTVLRKHGLNREALTDRNRPLPLDVVAAYAAMNPEVLRRHLRARRINAMRFPGKGRTAYRISIADLDAFRTVRRGR